MARGRSCLEVLFVMITYDELLVMMGVACWGWSISISLVLIGTDFWTLANKVPSSASMDEDITLRMMDDYI